MEINNYPNYLIYEDGRVYNKKYDRFRKPILNKKNGYLQIELQGKKFYIHRLIAIHYIPNPDNLPIIDHLDRNRLNNDILNLRWCNYYTNNQNIKTNKSNKLNERNISFSNTRKVFRFQKIINGNNYSKQFKTLEEAIIYRDNFLLLQQQEQ